MPDLDHRPDHRRTTDASASPAVKTARHLTEILTLLDALPAQALAEATAVDEGRSLPGGQAMVELGPVGDVETWGRRFELAEADWAAGRRPTRPDPTDEDLPRTPAVQTLVMWADHLRGLRDEEWDPPARFAVDAQARRQVHYLKGTLDWAAEHLEDRIWAQLRDAIRDARRQLENVVHAGARPDTTRVECNNPLCDPPDPARPDTRQRLIRVYALRWTPTWTCTACGGDTPARRSCDTCHRNAGPGVDRDRCGRQVGDRDPCDGRLHLDPVACRHCGHPDLDPAWTSDPADDRWKCTRCNTIYDNDAFRRAHAAQLRRDTAAKYVPLKDAIATLVAQGRNERTVRRWLEPPLAPVDRCTRCRRRWPAEEHNVCPRKLKDRAGALTGEECGGDLDRIHVGDPDAVVDGYCDLDTHQPFVWWPDLWRLHLATPTRNRRTA